MPDLRVLLMMAAMWAVVFVGLCLFSACVSWRALRRTPDQGRRFVCYAGDGRGGLRVMVVDDAGFTVYRNGVGELRLTFEWMRSVQVCRRRRKWQGRGLTGVDVESVDLCRSFFVMTHRFGWVSRARAHEAADLLTARMVAHSPSPDARR